MLLGQTYSAMHMAMSIMCKYIYGYVCVVSLMILLTYILSRYMCFVG